ncbi:MULTISPECIES: helix-turn-helix domain-containing protein [Myroides]|uniref:helix-turn-helix domain-containing protein n=1 Tax=Myroides odoratus TaxID=256 RepID=UPI000766161D|nr:MULTISPECIES: helix-turn-helix domain-containing protein [Myroides]WHT38803.1 helix-turn-helix domain-containing protein [Myroides sp. mNGS23_01]
MYNKNRKIVEFIRDEWLVKHSNNSQFARDHGIDEKIVRLIKDDNTYSISLNTLIKICDARGLSLQDFCGLAQV